MEAETEERSNDGGVYCRTLSIGAELVFHYIGILPSTFIGVHNDVVM